MPTYKYSISKVKYKFREINPFFNILQKNNIIEKPEEPEEIQQIPPPVVQEDQKMNSDNEIQEIIKDDPIPLLEPTKLFKKLHKTFMKLKKSARRQLEILITKHSADINNLSDREKADLLEAISVRFYKRSLRNQN